MVLKINLLENVHLYNVVVQQRKDPGANIRPDYAMVTATSIIQIIPQPQNQERTTANPSNQNLQEPTPLNVVHKLNPVEVVSEM